MTADTISPLRQRMIDDMNARALSPDIELELRMLSREFRECSGQMCDPK